jgi:hypothetical protein
MNSGLRGQLKNFLSSRNRNKWLCGRRVSVYVRKGKHLGPDGTIHEYLDLANIHVDERFQHKGIFKEFLNSCQELTPYDGVFIESVLNEGLRAHLKRKVESDKHWKEKDFNFIWEKPTQQSSS